MSDRILAILPPLPLSRGVQDVEERKAEETEALHSEGMEPAQSVGGIENEVHGLA